MRTFSASRANLTCRIVVVVRSSGRPKCYILSINFPSLQLKRFSMYSHYSRNESYKLYNSKLQAGREKIVCTQNAFIECLHRMPSQNIFTEYLHRKTSQNEFTECLYRVPSQSAFTECLHRMPSHCQTTKDMLFCVWHFYNLPSSAY